MSSDFSKISLVNTQLESSQHKKNFTLCFYSLKSPARFFFWIVLLFCNFSLRVGIGSPPSFLQCWSDPMVVDILLKLEKQLHSYPGPEFKGMIWYTYIYICEYDVDRCIYIYMLCIPWCILNPFITVVGTPFIPPFHNNHPFQFAGSEISSVLLVIRGRLGSLANEHPAGPSPLKILKTSTRGCWSIWEVHPVKNHFFRRYVVSFFWGGLDVQTKICYLLCSRPETKKSCCIMADYFEVHWSMKQSMWYICFPTGGSCWTSGMSTNHLKSKPGFWQ